MKNRAFFLDRDGVLNKAYKRPPNKLEELEVISGVGAAVKRLNQLGYRVFVVTNQGGVGLGYMSHADLDAIHAKLAAHIAAAGGHIDQFKACTHKPRSGCSCRKPKPGMLLELAEQYNVDLGESFMVGDREMDIEAGKRAGTKTIFIGSADSAPPDADLVSPSLLQAVTDLFGVSEIEC